MDQTKELEVVDVPGHYNYRQKVREDYLQHAKAIMIVIDSANKDSLSEAAELLFDCISDIEIQTDRVPILICCNKQDLTFSKKAT